MFNFIKEFSSFIFIILTTVIIGPIFSTSYYYSIKSDTVLTTLTSNGLIISITKVIIDSVLYGISLYLSNETINKLHDEQITVNYHKYFQSIIVQEKQLLEPINESFELFIRTQTNLYDIIKDIIQDNNTNHILIENTRNKLTTLEFIQNDSVMTIKKNINESLQLLKINPLINKNIKIDSYIIDRIYLFILTFSFLLYIHQIILWYFQYLTLENPKKFFSYVFILSLIILSQSLGFIYFLQITNIFYYLSLLSTFICIFFIRSLATIYCYAFSVY